MASFLVLMIVIGVSVWFGSLLGSWLAGKNQREESKKEKEPGKELEIDIEKLPESKHRPRTELNRDSETEQLETEESKTDLKHKPTKTQQGSTFENAL